MKRYLLFTVMVLLAGSQAVSQTLETETSEQQVLRNPQMIDFSRLFQQKELTRDDMEMRNREQQARLTQRLSQAMALEKAVNPSEYIVGPGDQLSLNVWGAMEAQVPMIISAEGVLNIPTVGFMQVNGMTLAELRTHILDKVKDAYQNSEITVSLEALRFFRVHVTGEVRLPGTYVAQAVDRVSELIQQAGGVSGWARRQAIEIRRIDGTRLTFDLDAFEAQGRVDQAPYVYGGDVIFVPPLELSERLVTVEGDMEVSGSYQIAPDEKCMDFLRRIRALKRNTMLERVRIRRSTGSNETTMTDLVPFPGSQIQPGGFILKSGDRIRLPSSYVYVKGNVRNPGAYPYSSNLTALDYAGMAGGDYRSGNIKHVRVYHNRTGKTEKGPHVLVEPGDVVHLNPTWAERLDPYIRLIPTITSLILAAKAAGLLGD